MPLNNYGSLLRVYVKAAYDLKDTDWIGKSDPFVRVEVEQEKSAPRYFDTITVQNSLNPVWNTNLYFLVERDFEKIKVSIKDKGMLHDKSLGHAYVLRKPEDSRFSLTGNKYYLEHGNGGTIEVWTQEIDLRGGLMNVLSAKSSEIKQFYEQKKVASLYVLSVLVHGAHNLPSGMIDKADPYAKVQFEESENVYPVRLKTRTIENNPNPVWESELNFIVPPNLNHFTVHVMDEDIGNDKELGKTSIVLKYGEWRKKERHALGKKGEVEVSYIVSPLLSLFEQAEPVLPNEIAQKVDPVVEKKEEHIPTPVALPEKKEEPIPTPVALPEKKADPIPVSIPTPVVVPTVLETHEAAPVQTPPPKYEPVAAPVQRVVEQPHIHVAPHVHSPNNRIDPYTLNGKTVVFKSKLSGKSLSVERAEQENGAKIHQWSFHGSANQKWKVHVSENGEFFFVSEHSGKALDSPFKNEGGYTFQWEHHRGTSQRFLLHPQNDGSFFIQSVFSGLYLDIYGGSPDDGAQLILWTLHGGDNQRFYFEVLQADPLESLHGRTVTVKSKHAGKCLSVEAASHDNGGNIHQWSDHGVPNQKWTFHRAPDGSFFLLAAHSGKALDAPYQYEGGNLHQWEHHGGDNQRFFLHPQSDGSFFIQCKSGGLYLDINGGSHDDGAQVILWSLHGGDNQRFLLG